MANICNTHRTSSPRLSVRGLALLGVAAPALLALAATAQVRRPIAKKPKAAPDQNALFVRDVLPFVNKYCIGCHSKANAQGGVILMGYKDAASVLKDRAVWERAVRNVTGGSMPPSTAPQPTPAEREKMAGWVDSFLTSADCRLQDPGRVTMRRLNREEYNNTIRDLFGVDIRPADEFPVDDVGYGFDNIGDVLSISPLLMEKYLNAAEKIAKRVIYVKGQEAQSAHFEADKFSNLGPSSSHGLGRMLASNGEIAQEYDFPSDGSYQIRVRAFGEQGGGEPCKMEIKVGGEKQAELDVPARNPTLYEIKVAVKKGRQPVAIGFLNDFYEEKMVPEGNRGRMRKRIIDRNLIVSELEIVGPLDANGVIPDSHRRIVTVVPGGSLTSEAAARKVLAPLAARAYRRPVTAAEVDRLVRYVGLAKKEGESYERGIQVAVQAMLVSPNFLFRVEKDPNPNDPKTKRLLNGYELASRLSYFLWSSMPDETLMKLAASNKLQDPTVLTQQAVRMLKDPKAHALTGNFAGQWLNLRKLSALTPDPARFPGFNEKLRQAMRRETELFFQNVVQEDRSVLEFLDANYTYLNGELAKHYGISNVDGDNFRRVKLADANRGGLITQASILTITSNPTRTSPVKRGKWVLEQILGTPPPPAPPNVPELEKGKLVGTLRERMEQHRKDAGCASCHARMDPLGFGMENYDAVGKWRTQDEGAKIDASGVLPDGAKFAGPGELKKVLLGKQHLFVHNLAEKLMTYALGRGLEPTDKCNVDTLVMSSKKKGYKFSSLVTAIVTSDPFRKRRGDGG